MRTFVTSRPVAQSFTPYRVMSETVRRRMYGRIYPSDAFGPRSRPTGRAVLHRLVGFAASIAIARGGK